MVSRFYRENIEQLCQAGYTPQDAEAAVEASLARLTRAVEGRRHDWHISPTAAEQLPRG